METICYGITVEQDAGKYYLCAEMVDGPEYSRAYRTMPVEADVRKFAEKCRAMVARREATRGY